MHQQIPHSTTLLRIAVPRLLGGEGLSWGRFVTAFAQQSASEDLGWMIAMAGQAWVLKALLDHGSPAQQALWVPRMLKGARVATALAEPQSGSDMAHVQTLLRAHGDGWLVTGQKRNISFGAEAEGLIGLGKSEPDGKFRLFLLDRATQPWQATPSPAKVGLASLPTADLRLDALPVSQADFVAPHHNGLATLADFMTFGRGLLALGATTILRHHLQVVLAFAAERQSGNVPIDEHQYVQLKLTDAQLQLTQARLLADRTLEAHLAGRDEAIGLGSMAKLAATQALLQCSQRFASILGTEGFQDGPIGRLAVDALGFQAVGGTEEVHRINVFRQMKAGRV